MTANDFGGDVRSPRISLRIDGFTVSTVTDLTLTDAADSQSNRFQANLTTRNLAGDPPWLRADASSASIDIAVLSSGTDTQLLAFHGFADQIFFDPVRQQARIRGRDESAILSESSPQLSYYNQTASEIVIQIATRHGLPAICTETADIVGSFRNGSHNQLFHTTHSQFRSEWDLLTHLARNEEFELFIRDRTLVFSPLAALPTRIWPISTSNVINMGCQRTLPLGGRPRLQIQSWNSASSQAFSFSIDDPDDIIDTTEGVPMEHVIVKPNLSPNDVEKLARRYMRQLKSQQTSIYFTMPGETAMRARDTISLSGVGKKYDTLYMISSIRRRFSSTGGFLQYVRATPTIPDRASPL
jgi:hypothetical protein